LSFKIAISGVPDINNKLDRQGRGNSCVRDSGSIDFDFVRFDARSNLQLERAENNNISSV